jgi:formiminotetrahydrofolate cyclodeaminase
MESMLTDLTIKKFLEQVASDQPVPGGGSVSALCAALSAGLSEMVARLTVGKTNDTALDEKLSTLIEAASRLRTKLIEDVDKDTLSFAQVMKAYRMPKGSAQEKSVRQKEVQDALTQATRVPLSVAETGVGLLTLAGTAVREGNSSAVTDAVVAALMARSAVIGALYNVRTNLISIKDMTFRDEIAKQVELLEKEAIEKERDILSVALSIIEKQARVV